MNAPAERILVVEGDPDISDLIIRQALQPLGYQTRLATDAGTAMREAIQAAPDLILADLNLDGLSGKDLIVALTSQGISTPLIVLANKGEEDKVIRAFRLGAADYLLLPARDAEIVSVVERVLKQSREARQRQQLDRRLKQTNDELQRRVRDLTTIFTIGRAVVSLTDQRLLFEKIVEGGLQVTEADAGWLLLRDEASRAFLLAAQRKLPEAWARKINQPFDDGISALVTASAESLAIHGEPLKQFKIAALAQSALAAPIKVQREVIGVIVMVRQAARPFGRGEQGLLGALADYASISLVNARLFRALAERGAAAQSSDKRRAEQLNTLGSDIRTKTQAALDPLEHLLSERDGALSPAQIQTLKTAKISLEQILSLSSGMSPT
jgi:DNA-binding response OmpR family regulator